MRQLSTYARSIYTVHAWEEIFDFPPSSLLPSLIIVAFLLLLHQHQKKPFPSDPLQWWVRPGRSASVWLKITMRVLKRRPGHMLSERGRMTFPLRRWGRQWPNQGAVGGFKMQGKQNETALVASSQDGQHSRS